MFQNIGGTWHLELESIERLLLMLVDFGAKMSDPVSKAVKHMLTFRHGLTSH